jgi:aldose 1-epimerase
MKSRVNSALVVNLLALLLSVVSSMDAFAAAGVVETPYGTTSGGQAIDQYTLTNSSGLQVTIITYGGIITSIQNPAWRMPNVVLGFNNLNDYETLNSPGPHFGAIIGRYANRIANGVFTLNGVTYCLDANNGPNTLHGGFKGFDTKVWTVTRVIKGASGVGIELNYFSPAGDGWTGTAPNPSCLPSYTKGFPGDLDTYVTYTLNNQNQLIINYFATTDAPTVVNLTNHTYWNLAGEGTGTVYSHLIQLNANQFTPVNSNQIPVGSLQSVTGTPFDFRLPTAVSTNIRVDDPQLAYGKGYDLNWVVNPPLFGQQLGYAAMVREPISGRTLTAWTDQPGIQFYSGNSLDGSLYGTSNREYRQSDGLALETQHYPNSPNQPDFPSTELDPGQTYQTHTIFQIQN